MDFQRLCKIATCTLNQFALDFEWNKNNIIYSIKKARSENCKIRLGPELEVTGYGCEDHFLEHDTFIHSWEVVEEILKSGVTQDIICCLGMPVCHKGVSYNCVLVILNGQILLIRPKIYLAEGGNYRESRWFSRWNPKNGLHKFQLPQHIQQVTGQKEVPFGEAILKTIDSSIAIEICQELWEPVKQCNYACFKGAEILLNPSGSHHELRKQQKKIELIKSATMFTGGVYVYSNLRGCDGGRVYYDGTSVISLNGEIMMMSEMFDLDDCDVLIGCMDLEEVTRLRISDKNWADQANEFQDSPIQTINVEFCICDPTAQLKYEVPITFQQISKNVENEISLSPSCYLWDYLKRSGARGYILPLSGGADSASSALIVYNMCKLVFEKIQTGKHDQVLQQLRGVLKDPSFVPESPQQICNNILFTVYMKSLYSSDTTFFLANELAKEINSTHYNVNIDSIRDGFISLAEEVFQERPQFHKTTQEDLALQNLQARSRMVIAYMIGTLIPWKLKKDGFLLVLGSANLDEGLRGYFTKYDCSSADINPLGSVSKKEIFSYLKWNYEANGIKTAKLICQQRPSAELRPEVGDQFQTDEIDMGMTYDELNVYGKERKLNKCGPVSMFKQLVAKWKHLTPSVVAEKVKKFFTFYAINRHKQTTLTPSYHQEPYSLDDNRFDLRQFLYNVKWPWQYKKIDDLVKDLEAQEKK